MIHTYAYGDEAVVDDEDPTDFEEEADCSDISDAISVVVSAPTRSRDCVGLLPVVEIDDDDDLATICFK